MTELNEVGALEAAALVRRGEASPVELVRACLDRIDRLDTSVGAFVTVTAERALAAARHCEDRAAGARRHGTADELPPLLGVPVAIKDLTQTAGVPTRFGSAAYADNVPATDDHVVTSLKAAGTIMVGKTNTPEFGAPCYTESDIAPPARTPWDLTRSAGGSSGGSAAAVAAGMVPFAQGNDGGGSVRIPASACGLVGLKVSRGRVSNGPSGGDLTGLSWHGPLARTVADAAAMLDAIAGYRVGDPHWAPPLQPGETFAGHIRRPPGRLRVGRYVDNLLGAPAHPDCVAAWESASGLLAELGHEVVDVTLPTIAALPAPMETFLVLWSSGYAMMPVPPEREHLLTPFTRMLRERGREVSAARYLTAVSTLQAASRQLIEAMWDFDAVLTPTLAQPPAPVGSQRFDDDPEADLWAQVRFTPYTSLYNTTGQPAISLPLFWSEPGLPIGIQLAGRPGDEAGLLRLAAQLESGRPWSHRHPPTRETASRKTTTSAPLGTDSGL